MQLDILTQQRILNSAFGSFYIIFLVYLIRQLSSTHIVFFAKVFKEFSFILEINIYLRYKYLTQQIILFILCLVIFMLIHKVYKYIDATKRLEYKNISIEHQRIKKMLPFLSSVYYIVFLLQVFIHIHSETYICICANTLKYLYKEIKIFI